MRRCYLSYSRLDGRWQVIPADYPSLRRQQRSIDNLDTNLHVKQQQSCVLDEQKLLATTMIISDHTAPLRRWQYE